MKTEYFEKIPEALELFVFDRETAKRVEEKTGVGTRDIYVIAEVYKLLRKKDAEGLIAWRENDRNHTNKIVEETAARMGLDIPEAYTEWAKERTEKLKEQAREKCRALGKEGAGKTYTRNYTGTTPLWEQQNLLNEAKIIEQIGDLNDAVIPKYARDIVEALNKLDTHLIQLINKLS